ncbi:response regulator [Aquimarina sp. ERC-38]|uniref:response regulator n=1 Tax=Aquimarina sp. ERC-38 TaxID=2949996 RepID=UPI002245B735|nr:response regulator [Aquimarina sp. ERC-38]UZO81790.1 response regulator [Aquimarina sp. ERC-38]
MTKKIELACLIDDDNMYISLMKKIVEVRKLCKTLLVFKNGQEALQYFETLLKNFDEHQIPEIVFLDLNMPIMDGWEFLDKFTQIKNKFGKIITLYVVSSSINPVDVSKAKGINSVTDYLIKPISLKELETVFLK